eukprot:2808501-Pleurochrysis_carterae.AAC.4
MFGFATRATDTASVRASLAASARMALLDALTRPVKALDACAAPFLAATANQAVVALSPVAVDTDVARQTRALKKGCALWATLAMLAGTPYHRRPAALAASRLR